MPASSALTAQVSACALTLRPVAVRVVSYGRSTKMAQRATLYVLRVARGGRAWFVARRFSEFRALFATLRETLARPHAGHKRLCPQCRELARRFEEVAFPSRYPLRSGFASAREKIESERMQQLDAFVQMLTETTQGLLATQDDEEDDQDDYDGCACVEDEEREDRCDALRLIREFLLVHDHLYDDKKTTSVGSDATPEQQDPANDDDKLTNQRSPDAPTPRRRARLGSSNSLGVTTTFRVQELDMLYRPTSPLSTWISVAGGSGTDLLTKATSPNVLDDDELDELFLGDYASPAQDAVIHRQLEAGGDPAVQVLRRAESLRMSRRL